MWKKIDVDALNELDLSARPSDSEPDVYGRIPAAQESVFRAAVARDGVPVCDVVQVWLDVSSHLARETSQTEEIRRRFLAPIFRQDGA